MGEIMVTKIHIGKVKRFSVELGEKLCIYREPTSGLPIEGIFEEFLGKKVKVTIEEIED